MSSSRPGDLPPPDAELERLVAGFLDETLSPEQSARLEERLRDEPAARDYCARALRFDATLQEALEPSQPLQWEETRRVTYDPRQNGPAWSVQRQQTFRYGDPRSSEEGAALLPGPPPRGKLAARWPLILAALVVIATAAAGWYSYNLRRNTYVLRNGDFEAMNLSQSPSGVGRSILYWQDNFSTNGAELCEISRVSGGNIVAHSGRNVLRLSDRAFVNQIILNQLGTPLKAAPGLKVILTGWGYTENNAPHALRGSLRYVASGYPDMIQYEAANETVPLEPGGWHPLRIELVVPADLTRPPSDISSNAIHAPAIDLDGKDLTLSLDSRSPGGPLYLDDLRIDVVKPHP